MLTLRIILKVIPWILIGLLLVLLYLNRSFSSKESNTIITHSTVLQEVEALGKMELVKYNFKDITELEKQSKEYFFKIIKFGPDSKIALISVGSATGCIDLTRLTPEDVLLGEDTIYIRLPPPELCNYQLNMEETHIYSLETNPMINEKQFIQKAYTLAEQRIRTSALESGILEQTETNAELILKPMLEKMSGKAVVFRKGPRNVVLPEIK